MTIIDATGAPVQTSDVSQNQVPEDSGSTTTSNPEPVDSSVPNQTNSGTTVAGKSGTTQTNKNNTLTIRPNPLSYFSSYTYQITLYMITPDALNSFIESGKKNISNFLVKPNAGSSITKGGAYIILQSGGVGSNEARAPGFENDFYIDNLEIKSSIVPSEVQASASITNINFTVIEPYGFKFINSLKKAADEVQKYSSTLNMKGLSNPSREFFILGIRFQGYDKYGNVFTGKETIDGRPIDPTGTSNGMFEKFYEVVVQNISFKLDGKATQYRVETTSISTEAMSSKRGTIPSQITVEARTVDEALRGDTGLIKKLDNYYDKLVATNKLRAELKPKFNIEYVGDVEDLKSAVLILPETNNKWKWPISSKDPVGAKVVPDNTKRMITFSHDPAENILQAIQKIVVESTYVRNGLKVSYTNDLEPNEQPKDFSQVVPDVPKILRWFNVSTRVKVIGYDDKTNEFVYDTTFVISPYEIPLVLTPYAKSLLPYYGPFKRYNYWFTGENTEIIRYEQTSNNSYYLPTQDPTLGTPGNTGNLPQQVGMKAPADSTGRLGAGNQTTAGVVASLFDPSSYVNSRLQILGDPDLLMYDSLNYDPVLKTFNQFYAPDGYTANPTGGQMFVEVNFNEGNDYNYNTGLQDINDSVVFWQYPPSARGVVKGVSFQLKNVTSYFRGGKFVQDLEMNLNLIPDTGAGSSNAGAGRGFVNPPNVIPDSGAGAGRGFVNPETVSPGAREGTGSSTVDSSNTTSNNTGLKTAPEAPADTQGTTTSGITTDVSPDNPGTTAIASADTDGGREEA